MPITMTYNAAKREATLSEGDSGLTFKVRNVTLAKAIEWRDKHAPEFFRRRCRMHSGGGTVQRQA